MTFSYSESRMLASSAVTFWRWLIGQAFPPEELPAVAAPSEERRVWLRHTANLNILCTQVGDELESAVSGVLRSISRGGMQMIAPRRFEPGSILSVESADSRREWFRGAGLGGPRPAARRE